MEFQKLQKIIGDVLDIEPGEIAPETAFVEDLGADSLDLFQIVMEIEEEFKIQIPGEAVQQIMTVGDAAEQIRQTMSQ
ncbi:MAG TPA: acyl carrier protein [Candidatus Enterocloster faecavium]|uniref:Acyl carrier protein n=1 Tax=Candidatus Enterocloster faecavium TaxID=2838560 RepID=A0A9D2RKW2_9FIRM|nr:acyl carrier protein [Candidatus Enterocloster faecavium]